MNTNLVYEGTLKTDINGSICYSHNAGSEHLFKLISTILSRGNFQTSCLPGYLQLCTVTPELLLETPQLSQHKTDLLLTSLLDIRSSYTNYNDETEQYETIFESTLDKTMLRNTSSQTTLTLVLVSANRDDILATVSFDSTAYDSILAGNQAIIRWILAINNKTIQVSNDETESLVITEV